MDNTKKIRATLTLALVLIAIMVIGRKLRSQQPAPPQIICANRVWMEPNQNLKTIPFGQVYDPPYPTCVATAYGPSAPSDLTIYQSPDHYALQTWHAPPYGYYVNVICAEPTELYITK